MTPKLQGLGTAMATLQHGLDERAAKLLARVDATAAASDAAFKKAHAHLDNADGMLTEMDKMISDLAANTNGGPTLDGSAGSSDTTAPLAPAEQAVEQVEPPVLPKRYAICSWGGMKFLADPLVEGADGTWKMAALQNTQRFHKGAVIEVKANEILEWKSGNDNG